MESLALLWVIFSSAPTVLSHILFVFQCIASSMGFPVIKVITKERIDICLENLAVICPFVTTKVHGPGVRVGGFCFALRPFVFANVVEEKGKIHEIYVFCVSKITLKNLFLKEGYLSTKKADVFRPETSSCTDSTDQKRLILKAKMEAGIPFIHTFECNVATIGPEYMWRDLSLNKMENADPLLLEPMGDQVRIAQKIVSQYLIRGSLNVLINGITGSGKSSVAKIVLFLLQLYDQDCDPIFTNQHNPTAPGDSTSNILRLASQKKPVVCCVNECDKLFVAAYEERVAQNQNVRTEVTDKSTLNTWLDNLSEQKSHSIFIFTMNSTLDELVKRLDGDSSLVRNGRFHQYHTLQKPVESHPVT